MFREEIRNLTCVGLDYGCRHYVLGTNIWVACTGRAVSVVKILKNICTDWYHPSLPLHHHEPSLGTTPPWDLLIKSSNKKVNSWPIRASETTLVLRSLRSEPGQSPCQLLIILNMISDYLHFLWGETEIQRVKRLGQGHTASVMRWFTFPQNSYLKP